MSADESPPVGDRADGTCRTCRGAVPPTNANLFYCSEPCRRAGWRKHHPDEPEPDWDNMPGIPNPPHPPTPPPDLPEFSD